MGNLEADQLLRESRLVFYKDQVDQIDRILTDLLRKAGARSAFLVDRDGHMITQAGEKGTFDLDTISALVASAVAATKEMAKLLGEREFSALFHQGARDNIQLSLVGERAILSILFDDSTTLGMVRLYVSDAVKRLAELFERAQRSVPAPSENLDAGKYGSDARDVLNKLFD